LAPRLAGAAGCRPLGERAPAQTTGGGELHFLHWRAPRPQKLAPMFEQYTDRTGPKINIEDISQAAYPAKLVATMAAGTPPDLMYSYSQNDTKHYDAGHPHLIAAATKYPDQAFDVVKYLASPPVQEFVGREGLTTPGLKSKYDTSRTPPPAHARVFREIYDRPRGIPFRHHNTVDNWDVYGKEILPIVAGERSLESGLRELNRMLNDKVEYGNCAPYKGLVHPLPAGA
jgi:ABC-type glycerol-3-phosphate transport system substrate-binding protein